MSANFWVCSYTDDTHKHKHALGISSTLSITYIPAQQLSDVTSQITARDFVFRMLSAWTITRRNTNLCFRGIELLIPVSGCVLKGARVCIRGCGAAACKECGAGSSEWTQGPRATAPSPGVSAALSPNPTARTSTWAQRCTHVNRQRPGNVSSPPKLIYQRQP